MVAVASLLLARVIAVDEMLGSSLLEFSTKQTEAVSTAVGAGSMVIPVPEVFLQKPNAAELLVVEGDWQAIVPGEHSELAAAPRSVRSTVADDLLEIDLLVAALSMAQSTASSLGWTRKSYLGSAARLGHYVAAALCLSTLGLSADPGMVLLKTLHSAVRNDPRGFGLLKGAALAGEASCPVMLLALQLACRLDGPHWAQ